MNKFKSIGMAILLSLLMTATHSIDVAAGKPILVDDTNKGNGGGPSHMPSRYLLYLELEDEENTDSLIFYYQGTEPVSYSLYSEDGELQLQGSCLFDSDSKCQVPLEELAPGTYTITIMVGGTMYEGTFLLEKSCKSDEHS